MFWDRCRCSDAQPSISLVFSFYVLPASGYGDILEIPDGLFAQQLTKMDCELFKRLIPHQCLGHVWSRRDKTARDKDAATVVATVDQVLYTKSSSS